MSPRSTGRAVLARIWMPLVAVVAVGVGLLCMYKVHQFSEPEPVITVNGPQAPEQFNLKRITYEVLGSVGQGGKLVYVDIDGHPHQVDITTLPWTHTESATLSVASGSISVHVHGGQVGCRMLLNDVVRDEQSDNHQNADVQCRVKSA
ncbi:MmpS family membrane protein [Mycobacterium lepraemurium]|nr:MmpS family transport accessory protein [Mycobacterium lepraemurium]ATA29234.1 MmpS family membrane protein [Mycobacterium lepraemurium]